MVKMIKVIIITSHQYLTKSRGIAHNQSFQIITFDNLVTSHKIMEQVHHHQPDILIVSYQITGTNALELIRKIANQYPEIGILAVAKPENLFHLLNALKAGARGCISPNLTEQELPIAVKAVYFGGTYFSSDHFKTLIKLTDNKDYQSIVAQDNNSFSEMELYVLQCICQEKETAEIALELNVKESSIKACRARLYQKTGSKHVAGLALYALRNGYFSHKV